MKKISEIIRAAVQKKIKSGVTPYVICKALDIDAAILSRWLSDDETKRRGISVETQDKLAEYLGIVAIDSKALDRLRKGQKQ